MLCWLVVIVDCDMDFMSSVVLYFVIVSLMTFFFSSDLFSLSLSFPFSFSFPFSLLDFFFRWFCCLILALKACFLVYVLLCCVGI